MSWTSTDPDMGLLWYKEKSYLLNMPPLAGTLIWIFMYYKKRQRVSVQPLLVGLDLSRIPQHSQNNLSVKK
jgi:hypothetical protein